METRAGQPCVAEVTSDLNGDRKRKLGTLDILRESWGLSDGYGDGTLLDGLLPFYKERLPHLEEWSDKSEDDSVVKTPPPVTMVSGLTVNDMVTKDDTGSNQIRNINVLSHAEKSKDSEGYNSTAQDEFNEPPELRFEEKTPYGKDESSQVGPTVDAMITEGDTGSNQTRILSVSCHEEVLKGPEGSNNITKYEFNESPKFHFEDNKTIDQMGGLSQVGLKVDCGFGSVSDDYESVLEPMQSITPCQHVSSVDSDMVLDSENTKTQRTSLNNNSGSGSGITKTSTVSSVNCDMESESENNKARVVSSVDKGSVSGSRNMKIASVSLADSFSASQIKQHLSSFNRNNKTISENKEASSNQTPCQLCCEHKIMLAPAPMY